jgi:hypothetical protein
MKNTIPSLPRVSQDEYDVMTDNEKRQYIIQLQQENTMKWQKIVAQFQSYMILLSIVVGLFYGGLIIRNKVVERMENQIQLQSNYSDIISMDTMVYVDTVRFIVPIEKKQEEVK